MLLKNNFVKPITLSNCQLSLLIRKQQTQVLCLIRDNPLILLSKVTAHQIIQLKRASDLGASKDSTVLLSWSSCPFCNIMQQLQLIFLERAFNKQRSLIKPLITAYKQLVRPCFLMLSNCHNRRKLQKFKWPRLSA